MSEKIDYSRSGLAKAENVREIRGKIGTSAKGAGKEYDPTQFEKADAETKWQLSQEWMDKANFDSTKQGKILGLLGFRNGSYEQVIERITQFQKDNEIDANGIIGPQTLEKIDSKSGNKSNFDFTGTPLTGKDGKPYEIIDVNAEKVASLVADIKKLQDAISLGNTGDEFYVQGQKVSYDPARKYFFFSEEGPNKGIYIDHTTTTELKLLTAEAIDKAKTTEGSEKMTKLQTIKKAILESRNDDMKDLEGTTLVELDLRDLNGIDDATFQERFGENPTEKNMDPKGVKTNKEMVISLLKSYKVDGLVTAVGTTGDNRGKYFNCETGEYRTGAELMSDFATLLVDKKLKIKEKKKDLTDKLRDGSAGLGGAPETDVDGNYLMVGSDALGNERFIGTGVNQDKFYNLDTGRYETFETIVKREQLKLAKKVNEKKDITADELKYFGKPEESTQVVKETNWYIKKLVAGEVLFYVLPDLSAGRREGGFEKDRGNGKFKYPNGTYEGTFKDGKPEGTGTITLNDAAHTKITGTFVDGKLNGKTVETLDASDGVAKFDDLVKNLNTVGITDSDLAKFGKPEEKPQIVTEVGGKKAVLKIDITDGKIKIYIPGATPTGTFADRWKAINSADAQPAESPWAGLTPASVKFEYPDSSKATSYEGPMKDGLPDSAGVNPPVFGKAILRTGETITGTFDAGKYNGTDEIKDLTIDIFNTRLDALYTKFETNGRGGPNGITPVEETEFGPDAKFSEVGAKKSIVKFEGGLVKQYIKGSPGTPSSWEKLTTNAGETVKFTYSSGDTYEGEWDSGLRQGDGKYQKSGGLAFVDTWESDEPKNNKAIKSFLKDHGTTLNDETWPNKNIPIYNLKLGEWATDTEFNEALDPAAKAASTPELLAKVKDFLSRNAALKDKTLKEIETNT